MMDSLVRVQLEILSFSRNDKTLCAARGVEQPVAARLHVRIDNLATDSYGLASSFADSRRWLQWLERRAFMLAGHQLTIQRS